MYVFEYLSLNLKKSIAPQSLDVALLHFMCSILSTLHTLYEKKNVLSNSKVSIILRQRYLEIFLTSYSGFEHLMEFFISSLDVTVNTKLNLHGKSVVYCTFVILLSKIS